MEPTLANPTLIKTSQKLWTQCLFEYLLFLFLKLDNNNNFYIEIKLMYTLIQKIWT